MSPSHSVAQAVAEAAANLEETFELGKDASLPSNVTPFRPRKTAAPTPKTLAECVPLLSVALEVVRHGPDGISIEDVERYRIKASELLSHVQPVVERRADLTLDDWAASMLLEPAIARTLSND